MDLTIEQNTLDLFTLSFNVAASASFLKEKININYI